MHLIMYVNVEEMPYAKATQLLDEHRKVLAVQYPRAKITVMGVRGSQQTRLEVVKVPITSAITDFLAKCYQIK